MTRYRVPTHLDVEPSLIRAELGPVPIDLTFRQAASLACVAGLAYWLWQGSGLPAWLVVTLTLLALGLALLTAFATVGGRSADLWLRDALHYLARPRRLVWRAEEDRPAGEEIPDDQIGPSLAVTWVPARPADGADD